MKTQEEIYKQSPWIDVSIQMPDMGKEIILYRSGFVYIGHNHEGKFYDFEDDEINKVTHWMEIPSL